MLRCRVNGHFIWRLHKLQVGRSFLFDTQADGAQCLRVCEIRFYFKPQAGNVLTLPSQPLFLPSCSFLSQSPTSGALLIAAAKKQGACVASIVRCEIDHSYMCWIAPAVSQMSPSDISDGIADINSYSVAAAHAHLMVTKPSSPSALTLSLSILPFCPIAVKLAGPQRG